MKISEVASKTDKQFHEDLEKSIGLTLKKFGNKILSAAGNKSAKEEALVLEVIDQLQGAFIAKNKAAGKAEGQTSFTDLAQFLVSAGIQDKAVKQGFKTAFAVVDTPDVESDPADVPDVGQTVDYDEPAWKRQGIPNPVESIIREFKADDLIPKARLVDGIEAVVRIQFKLNGLKGIQIPEYLGNPTKRVDQLMNAVSQEMDKELKNRDTDGDGVIDDVDGDGQPDNVGADDQQDEPEVDDETVNQIAAQIFTLTPDQRAMLTQAIRARNIQISQQSEKPADREQSNPQAPKQSPEQPTDKNDQLDRIEKKLKQQSQAKKSQDFSVKRAVGAGAKAADKALDK